MNKIHYQFLIGVREDEDVLEAWYEERVRDTLRNQDDAVYKGDLSPGASSVVKVELTKK